MLEMPKTDSVLMKPQEVADLLVCGERQVRLLINRGELSGVLVGNRWRVHRRSVEDYLAKRDSRNLLRAA